jgi:hypothetical protein
MDAGLSAHRESDGAELYVRLFRASDEATMTRGWARWIPQTGYAGPHVGFSGLPIGMDVRQFPSARSVSVEATDGAFSIEVRVSFIKRPRPQNDYVDPSADPDEKIACEGMARRILARARGLESRSSVVTVVGSTSVATLIGARGDTLVDLQGYCRARGLALTMNARAGAASFAAPNGDAVVIPLAAPKLKAGARWIESHDISVMKSGIWYVPLNALNSACQG